MFKLLIKTTFNRVKFKYALDFYKLHNKIFKVYTEEKYENNTN